MDFNNVSDDFRDVWKHKRNNENLTIILRYDGEHNEVERRESWTNLSGKTLRLLGFKRGYGFKDKLAFTGVKVYVKLIDFNQAIPVDQETAESLRNFLESKASAQFKKGFAKTSMDTLQMKQLITIIPIVIGIILGVWLFFGGGF